MTHTLRRYQRLLTAGDYRQVFSDTERRAGRSELLMLARRNGLPQHRLGLAIAKKHVPRAVKRNLIKRLAREQFRRLENAHPALDVVILSRPAARDADRKRLSASIEGLLQRLGLQSSVASSVERHLDRRQESREKSRQETNRKPSPR